MAILAQFAARRHQSECNFVLSHPDKVKFAHHSGISAFASVTFHPQRVNAAERTLRHTAAAAQKGALATSVTFEGVRGVPEPWYLGNRPLLMRGTAISCSPRPVLAASCPCDLPMSPIGTAHNSLTRVPTAAATCVCCTAVSLRAVHTHTESRNYFQLHRLWCESGS